MATGQNGEGYCFAARYTTNQVLCDSAARQQFLQEFLALEKGFAQRGVGISSCGFTVDGVHLVDDGQLLVRGHSNPSKESLHIALLSLAISSRGLIESWVGSEEALRQLEDKANALDVYREHHPHAHGFMPWFDSLADARPLGSEIAVRYNGMLAWSLYFAQHKLHDMGHASLASRFGAHLTEMKRWAVRLAYKGGGKVAAWFTVCSRTGAITQSEQNCEDPFAGELFCTFLDLLAEWGDRIDERDSIWSDPGRLQWLGLKALDCGGDEMSGALPIECMLHNTFSVHEEWKYLLLPYLKISASRRLLHAAEKVRTAYSRSHDLPGLLGDCHVPVDEGECSEWPTCHVTTFGIPGVSNLCAGKARKDYVAGCGAFGILLAEPAVGAAWLHRTLLAHPGMQTKWGMAESCSSDSLKPCPLLTWDAKATTALAILGGLGEPMWRCLQNDSLSSRFTRVIESTYGRFASGRLAGELQDFSLPSGMQFAWRQSSSEAQLDVDLDLVEGARRVSLPAADARTLSEIRLWFESHECSTGIDAAYTFPVDFDDWCLSGNGQYVANGADLQKLYKHVVDAYHLGVPLGLLARQAPRYPLFFDIDIYGEAFETMGDDANSLRCWRSNRVHEIVWDGDQVLLKATVLALLQIYPQFQKGLEVAVFCSSGCDLTKGRNKASYHLVFPQLIVDRPVKAWPENPLGQSSVVNGRHIIVRDHVVYMISQFEQESNLVQALMDDLLDCSDWVTVEHESDPDSDNGNEPIYLNSWSEIFDERPLWHEPWPGAATGLRLPFTDKISDACPEGRPKLPLGRWLCTHNSENFRASEISFVRLERLPDLEMIDSVRLGDISVTSQECVTDWSEQDLHEAVKEQYELAEFAY